jgi:WD40 repeat protein
MKNNTNRHLQSALWILLCPLLVPAQKPELVVQTGHGTWIQSIAFSHDRKILATGGGEGTIKLWEVDTGRLIRTLPGHPSGEVNVEFWVNTYDPVVNFFSSMSGGLRLPHSLSFSPDGETLASGSNGGTIIIWDIATGERKQTFTTPSGVWLVAFSRDGRTLLSKSELKSEDGSYRYWDVKGGAELKGNFPPLSDFQLPWQSPDGRRKVVHSEADTAIRVLDSADKSARILKGNGAGVRRAIFSPRGDILASGGWDRVVRVWDLAGDGRPRVLGRHDSFVSSLAFSADGRWLASGSGDSTVALWDVAGGKKLRVFRGYTNETKPHAFGANSNFLITKSGGSLHIWDLKKGRKLVSTRIHLGNVNAILFSPNKKYLATSDQGMLNLTAWLVRATRGESTRKALSFPKLKLPGDIDEWVEYPVSDNIIKLWGADGRLAKELKGHTDSVIALAFSRDEEMLASGGEDKTVKLWRIETDEKPITLTGHRQTVTAVNFRQDGRLLASGDTDGGIKVWQVGGGTERTLSPGGRGGSVKWLLFSEVDETLISFQGDDLRNFTISVWDLEANKLQQRFSLLDGPEKMGEVLRRVPNIYQKMNAAFTDDNKFYALEGRNDRVELYERAALSRRQTGFMVSLVAMGDEDWAVVTPDGRFDTNKLENPEGLQWLFPDAPLTPLSFEIFMRDYYEPRLLPRLLKGEKLPELPSLAELNRIQPKIEKITVHPQPGRNDSVDVKVEVASVAGRCLKGDKQIPCESGVYDLRLYRDGQLVGQHPQPAADGSTAGLSDQDRAQRLERWREGRVVKTVDGRPVTSLTGAQTITFNGVRLPRRPGVSQVEFTAYAFNEDRVKSATSHPFVYELQRPRPASGRRAYAIMVGVDATSDPSLRLGFAPNGAREIESLLREKLQSDYEFVSVPLISEYREGSPDLRQYLATKVNIRTVIDILSGREVKEEDRRPLPNQEKLRAATPDDLVVIYVASHGYADPRGTFYVIPSDIGEPAGVSEQLLNRCVTGAEQSSSCRSAQDFLQLSISSDELTRWLQDIDAGQMVLILDSCHSAAVSGPNFKPGPMGDRSFGQLSYDKGMLVLAATQAENVAWGTLELGDRSLLTHALTQQQGEPFDFRGWLSRAEKQVPELYGRFVRTQQSASSDIQQAPELFDFTRKRTSVAGK